ncbi:pimeloyl-ACP methyl ester carboxylesterase [Neomicrococcus aestuarii]|uniref:Pimeloyl-ACP methyl ester carboxylesterase n=1 Tax=Neomicrococcus aestuarii TaxID=556325 RepID=A0A7W8TT17_9MICC|nr:alpha/beta hydrolase [Neomicrococcus aestuarii]MBB5512379.1 pimeloyl-ACP methyl ester carboxylesterase [Neomicrococcus aestuarii]
MTKTRVKLAALIGSVTLALTACVPGSSNGSSSASGSGASATATTTTQAAASSLPAAPAGLEDYYGQQPEWEKCGNLECANVEVPLDYKNPAGERISIAVNRLKATDTAQGSIIINPGGPGASGVDLVASGSAMFSETLKKNFNVVGFDPRGISRSEAVECLTDAERDEAATDNTEPENTTAYMDFVEDSVKEYTAKCAEKSSKILGFVDTASSARDLDILRDALGDSKLNYLGYSYGTKLGATYAGLFQENTGKLVLDGAMDPSLNESEITIGQAKGFENAITAYLEDCLSDAASCPFEGSVDDAREQLISVIDSVIEQPIPTNMDREVSVTQFVNGFITPFYEDSLWPLLSLALTDIINDDNGDNILALADASAGREDNGTYNGNQEDAFNAVNCLDYPRGATRAQMSAEYDELVEASPVLGRFLAFGGFMCNNWPVEATNTPAPASADNAAPIVIIGTTGDPATPYEWSKSLNEQLKTSVLVTYEGEGHTAYGRSNPCITDAVDTYFVEGTVPQDGLTC